MLVRPRVACTLDTSREIPGARSSVSPFLTWERIYTAENVVVPCVCFSLPKYVPGTYVHMYMRLRLLRIARSCSSKTLQEKLSDILFHRTLYSPEEYKIKQSQHTNCNGTLDYMRIRICIIHTYYNTHMYVRMYILYIRKSFRHYM